MLRVLLLVVLVVGVVGVCFAQNLTLTVGELGQQMEGDMLAAVSAVAPYIFKVAVVIASVFMAVSLMRAVAFRL